MLLCYKQDSSGGVWEANFVAKHKVSLIGDTSGQLLKV